MSNFILNLIKRGAGIEHSQIFKPASPAIFLSTLNNPVLVSEMKSNEQIDLVEPIAPIKDQKESRTIDSLTPDSDAMYVMKKTEFESPIPSIGSKYSGVISVPPINIGSTNIRQDSQQLSEGQSSIALNPNIIHPKSEEDKKEEIAVNTNSIAFRDSSRRLADLNDTQIRNNDLITQSDNRRLDSQKSQDQAFDLSARAAIPSKIVRIFRGISEAKEHETPITNLAPSKPMSAYPHDVSNSPIQDPVLIRPALPVDFIPSASSQASPKGSGIEGESTVQIRIGTIDVRAVSPQTNSSSPSIPLPKGFDDYYMARNYLNQ